MPRYGCTLFFFLLCWLLFPAAPSLRAQSGAPEQDPLRTLVRRMVVMAGTPGSAAFSLDNLAGFGSNEVSQIQAAFQAELAAYGFRLAPLPADLEFHVTLSEDPREEIWVGELRRAGTSQIVMVSFPRLGAQQPSVEGRTLRLERQAVWQQDEPILDFALFSPAGAPQELVVAGPERLDVYVSQGGQWTRVQSLPIVHPSLLPVARVPRDFRGRLLVSGNSLELFLPAQVCKGTLGANVTGFDCQAQAESWPLGACLEYGSAAYTPGENHFAGTLDTAGGTQLKLAPFFSGAAIGPPSSNQWILAGADGVARLYDNADTPSATFPGWGSETVAVQTGCGRGTQVLVTGPGDWTKPDTLRAYEIVDHQGEAVSAEMPLAGPALALWPGEDGQAARLVTHNLETGQYEASMVQIRCGR